MSGGMRHSRRKTSAAGIIKTEGKCFFFRVEIKKMMVEEAMVRNTSYKDSFLHASEKRIVRNWKQLICSV